VRVSSSVENCFDYDVTIAIKPEDSSGAAVPKAIRTALRSELVHGVRAGRIASERLKGVQHPLGGCVGHFSELATCERRNERHVGIFG